jgi:hypothetical protein
MGVVLQRFLWRIAKSLVGFNFNTENVPMLIVTIAASLFFAYFDFMGLKDRFGDGVGVGIYVVIGISFWYLISEAFIRWVFIPNISIRDGGLSDGGLKSSVAISEYAGLEVTPPPFFDITDCYMTIEKAIRVLDEYGERLSSEVEFEKQVGDQHIGKHLLCANKLSTNGYMIDIPGGKPDSFFVAQINIGPTPAKDGSWVFMNFEFSEIEKLKSNYRSEKPLGLYEVSVDFHFRLDNRKMNPIRVDGYAYSSVETLDKGEETTVIFGRGDWRSQMDKIPFLRKI